MPEPKDTRPQPHGYQQQAQYDPDNDGRSGGEDGSDGSFHNSSVGDNPDEDSNDNDEDDAHGLHAASNTTAAQPKRTGQGTQNQSRRHQQAQKQQPQTQAYQVLQKQEQQVQRSQGQSQLPATLSGGSRSAIPNAASKVASSKQEPATAPVYIIIIVDQIRDVSTLDVMGTYSFRNHQIFTSSTIAEVKALLTQNGCQWQHEDMHLQVRPSPYFPRRVVLSDDTRTLSSYGVGPD